ncbi:MAG: hypothetical protein KBF12_06970 [Sebaldella sp.]|nr:hypothetical protein [Sebaldella sp.]
MKKIVFILLMLVSSFVFSIESNETIIKLINDVEKNPTSESSLEKYKKIIEFSEGTKEAFVMFMPELTVFEEKNITGNMALMLVGSYTAGALKPQLVEKKALISISDGIKQEMKVYKLLKKSNNININVFDAMLSLEQEGKSDAIYNYYIALETRAYQNRVGIFNDIEIIVTKLKIPTYINVNNEKILLVAVSVGTPRDLSSTLNFGIVSDASPKDQEKVAKEVLKYLLLNEDIKKAFKNEVYFGAGVQFLTSKNGLSKDQISKLIKDSSNKNSGFDIRKEFQMNTINFSKDQINSFIDSKGTTGSSMF